MRDYLFHWQVLSQFPLLRVRRLDQKVPRELGVIVEEPLSRENLVLNRSARQFPICVGNDNGQVFLQLLQNASVVVRRERLCLYGPCMGSVESYSGDSS